MSLQVWMPMNGDLTLKGCQSFVPKVSGAISFANSNMGQCLCCSGQVIIPAQKVAKIFNNTAMTVAFWYNNNGGATGSHPICGFGGNTDVDGRIYDIFQYDTKNDLHWSMDTLGGHTQKGIIPDNTWIHVCVTYSSGVSRMYVNGSQIWVNNNATSNFTFNKDYYVSYGYNQKICDFRIYDNALSPKEVHILSMGLWGHYSLSDSSFSSTSKKLYDSSGYNYNGERIGNISIDSPSVRNSYCASTSGNTGSSHSSNYIHIATKAVSVDVFTVAGWVKYTDLGSYPTFLSASRESPQSTGLWLCVNAEGHGLWAYVYDVKNEYLSYTDDPLLSSNTWYHFAFTFNKGKVQMFRNGVPVSNVATWNKTSVNLSNIYLFDSYIGSTWDTHFNGSLSDIRFYSKVLTQSEIKQLYDTPIHITNSGTLLTQGEFVEGGGMKARKDAIVSSPLAIETSGSRIKNTQLEFESYSEY